MTAPGEPILPAPAPPDFLLCDPAYGTNLKTLDCLHAAGNMQQGTSMENYFLGTRQPRVSFYALPQVYYYGSCRVAVQFSYFRGVHAGAVLFRVAPNDLRNLAARVIQRCVTVGRGIGGFGTFGIANLLDYASLGYTPYNLQSFPASTAFLTINVMNRNLRSLFPGDTDPSIAMALVGAAPNPSARSGSSAINISPSEVWLCQLEQMSRAGSSRWYTQYAQVSDEMEYQCDATLGAPSAVDCTHIEWNQLTPSVYTLAVGPDVTTFLHSNTCYLAISAVVSLVLTWAQIRTAVSVLMNACIQAPLQPPRGGRAHYVTPLQISKRQHGEVTGLNALPPSVNITIFEQQEGWEGPAAELTSCTWTAVSKGTSISNCHKT